MEVSSSFLMPIFILVLLDEPLRISPLVLVLERQGWCSLTCHFCHLDATKISRPTSGISIPWTTILPSHLLRSSLIHCSFNLQNHQLDFGNSIPCRQVQYYYIGMMRWKGREAKSQFFWLTLCLALCSFHCIRSLSTFAAEMSSIP